MRERERERERESKSKREKMQQKENPFVATKVNYLNLGKVESKLKRGA